jgi:hypothetical protein
MKKENVGRKFYADKKNTGKSNEEGIVKYTLGILNKNLSVLSISFIGAILFGHM